MLAVTSSTTQTISLSIDGGSGRRDAYYVMYNIFGQQPAIRSDVTDNGPMVTHVLVGLTSGALYEIEVYAQSGQISVNSEFSLRYTGTAAVTCNPNAGLVVFACSCCTCMIFLVCCKIAACICAVTAPCSIKSITVFFINEHSLRPFNRLFCCAFLLPGKIDTLPWHTNVCIIIQGFPSSSIFASPGDSQLSSVRVP